MSELEPIHLQLERHTLANGLQVVLHPDRTLPLVALNLWYHVGSKNESPGRTGLAHLFEHLLFQGSQHVGTNDHFRLIQQAGGTANGSTWYDRTNYHCVLPAHQLDLGLWLEADRMGFFLESITQEKLDNQREVVINERRQRIDNQPYGRAFERVHELLYSPDHPYRWPVIGYIDHLEEADLGDVRDFFQRFYIPNNTVLTVAGHFGVDVLEHIERYFGEIPAGDPIPPHGLGMQPPTESRRDVLRDKVELPRVYLAFQVPGFGSREWYAADFLASILTDGKTSLLYEDLVYQRRIAQDVSCFVLPTETAASFVLMATGVAGGDPRGLEDALREHLRAVAGSPPQAEQVERARSRLLTLAFHQLQTLDRRADLLSHFTTFFNAPERATEETMMYQSLEAEELTSLVRTYCREDREVVLTVVPEKSTDAEKAMQVAS